MFRTLRNLAPVTEWGGTWVAKILRPSLTSRFASQIRDGSNPVVCARCYSSSYKKEEAAVPETGQLFKHDRHNMYVCWHPEVPFPYEMTKPIDTSAPVTESNMKIQALVPVRESFRKKSQRMMIQELIKLTYSTKHRFYGMFGKKKRHHLRETDPNKKTRNRDYL